MEPASPSAPARCVAFNRYGTLLAGEKEKKWGGEGEGSQRVRAYLGRSLAHAKAGPQFGRKGCESAEGLNRCHHPLPPPLSAGCDDGTVAVWDMDTRGIARTVRAHR
jgi:hypothetical protein